MANSEFDALKIVRDALDTDPGDRARYVEQRCSGNSELQARVLSMLERIGGADPMDDDAADDLKHADQQNFSELDDPLVGDRLGAYRVAERVGRGGMGIVYRGLREGADFAQEVAIKLIRRGYDFDDVHARFLRERRILARLSHPNLARFIDGGVAANGRPWFALEFVRGEPITSWCDSKRLTIRERLQLFLDVCSAVQYAHTRLVIHRDLKPGNVLVDDSGMVRLLDFGVAGLIAGNQDDDEIASTIGMRPAMTPEYAAPEQFSGAVVGVSADVYSLGVLAYELIAGVLPYAINRHDQLATARIVATTPPQSLAAAIARSNGERSGATAERNLAARRTSAGAFRRLVRGDLGRIIDKALAKEPERRYATVQAFADDLARWLVGAPVLVTGNRLGYRTAKFVQRNRMLVGLGGLAFALLIAGVVGIAWKSREALQQAERATAVKTFVLSLFDSNVPGGAVNDVPSTRDLLNRGVERVQTEMKDQPLLRADMLTTLGRIHNQLSLYDEADPLLRQALALEEADGRGTDVDRAGTLRELALSMHERQRYPEATALLEQALPLVAGRGDAPEAEVRQLLGVALTLDHKPDQGLPESLKSIAIWRGIEKPPGDKVANALVEYASALTNSGKPDESLLPYREALAILRPLHDGVHADIAATASNIGVSLMMLGQFNDALVPLSEAVEVGRKVYGSNHRALAVSLSNLGAAQTATGLLEEAEKTLRESVAVRSAVYGEDSAETAKSSVNLVVVLTRLERYAQVEALMRPAIGVLEKTPGDWRRYIVIAKNNLALALIHLGRTDEARTILNEAIKLYSELDPNKNSLTAMNLQSQLGEIALRDEKFDAATTTFRELLDRSLANMPANAAGLPDRYDQLGRVELQQGKLSQAKEHFQESIRLEAERAGTVSPPMVRARLGLAKTLVDMKDESAAREQLALLAPALKLLPPDHSQRKRAEQLEALLNEQAH
ncbi:MAG: serine/threonine-protein kinase [Dokdonella sp.]